MKIRNCAREDIQAYVEFINKANIDAATRRILTVNEAKVLLFDSPNYDQKGHFIAFENDTIIASAMGSIKYRNNPLIHLMEL